MAPAIASYARSIISRALYSSDSLARSPNPQDVAAFGPLKASSVLLARDVVNTPDPEKGLLHPGDINNNALFAIFGIIGAAFVVLGIWFFFWAKNGGFYFKENDWDDYKTTVMRRRGPNGTILSGATESTQLGGGSVFKDYDDDTSTAVSGSTGITGITAGVSDIVGREKHRKKRAQKEREKERRREEKGREKAEKKKGRSKSRSKAPDTGVVDEEAEAAAEEYLRNYRHEKPARVGGLNKESDASEWDGSTNPSSSSHGGGESTVTSELLNHRERTPTSSPTKKSAGGIRKVYSTADRRDDRESERIKAEARRLQERGRAATSSHRRDFSFQRHNKIDETTKLEAESNDDVETSVPGSWTESQVGSEVGTKVYNHVIPGLASSSGAGPSVAGTDVKDYADGKRKKRSRGEGGYRRERERK